MKKYYVVFGIICMLSAFNAQVYSQVIWDGPDITFTKDNYANWTLPENQDRITDDVWITRANTRPIFNAMVDRIQGSPKGTQWAYGSIADGVENLYFDDWVSCVDGNPPSMVGEDMVLYLIQEDIYIDIMFSSWTQGGDQELSPFDTKWAFGSIADGVENLSFNYWKETVEGNPPGMVDQNMVLHLLSDDIYIDIMFTSWTGSDGGGGFSYERASGDLSENYWTGEKITFTKDDYADWTLAENQDRITDNVWITRANQQGIFNIVVEDHYDDFQGTGGGFSYERASGDLSENYWTGNKITFTKDDFADWTLAENQDRVTDDVWITRADQEGIFNIAVEDSYDRFNGFGNTIVASPLDTEWAFGSIEDGVETLNFNTWVFTIEESPLAMIGQDMVVHLIEDDIYIDILFNSWTSGEGEGGGGFSYERSTGELSETYWTGEKISFTKDNYADWTLAENQDRITDNVWITRADQKGIFNIAKEEIYHSLTSTVPTYTKWAFGTTDDGIENLYFDYFLDIADFGPPSLVGVPLVLKLEPDDIYIDITFTSWTKGDEVLSPYDTKWAFGSIEDGVENLHFDYWKSAVDGDPPSMVDQNMVVHLLSDDIYIDIMFTSWAQGGSGGGFSYERATGDISESYWTGEKITFTKENFADWTQAENQDRITDNVWITRADQQGIFNIAAEDYYDEIEAEAGGGFSYIRSTNPNTVEQNKNSLKKPYCYPNPAIEVLNVKVNDLANSNIEIYNMLGKKLLSADLIKSNTQLSIKDLNSGVYIFKINESGKTTSGKLLIE